MGKVSLNFVMVENMKDNGEIIRWMVMVHLHGLMEDNMMDMYKIMISFLSMSRIRNKDLETLFIKMGPCIKEIGLKGENMEMGHFIQKVDCVERGNG